MALAIKYINRVSTTFPFFHIVDSIISNLNYMHLYLIYLIDTIGIYEIIVDEKSEAVESAVEVAKSKKSSFLGLIFILFVIFSHHRRPRSPLRFAGDGDHSTVEVIK